jgi:hypothetical protein
MTNVHRENERTGRKDFHHEGLEAKIATLETEKQKLQQQNEDSSKNSSDTPSPLRSSSDKLKTICGQTELAGKMELTKDYFKVSYRRLVYRLLSNASFLCGSRRNLSISLI